MSMKTNEKWEEAGMEVEAICQSLDIPAVKINTSDL